MDTSRKKQVLLPFKRTSTTVDDNKFKYQLCKLTD